MDIVFRFGKNYYYQFFLYLKTSLPEYIKDTFHSTIIITIHFFSVVRPVETATIFHWRHKHQKQKDIFQTYPSHIYIQLRAFAPKCRTGICESVIEAISSKCHERLNCARGTSANRQSSMHSAAHFRSVQSALLALALCHSSELCSLVHSHVFALYEKHIYIQNIKSARSMSRAGSSSSLCVLTYDVNKTAPTPLDQSDYFMLEVPRILCAGISRSFSTYFGERHK